MKRITFIIAALAVAASMQGQEKKWSLDYEVGLGMTKFFNYSALSLQEDNTASYTAPTASFTFGLRRDDGFSFGLRYSNTAVNTSNVAMQEHATLHDFSLVVRRSAMLSQRVELYGSATLGFAILHNSLVYNGDNLSANRYGYSAGLEAGLRYYFSSEAYFFVSAGLSAVNLTNVKKLPSPQTQNGLAASHLTGGFGIGFRPKVKKLNMPAEVIDRKEPLQLAYYPTN